MTLTLNLTTKIFSPHDMSKKNLNISERFVSTGLWPALKSEGSWERVLTIFAKCQRTFSCICYAFCRDCTRDRLALFMERVYIRSHPYPHMKQVILFPALKIFPIEKKNRIPSCPWNTYFKSLAPRYTSLTFRFFLLARLTRLILLKQNTNRTREQSYWIYFPYRNDRRNRRSWAIGFCD